MPAKYLLYGDEIKQYVAVVDKSQPVVISVMEQNEKIWKKVKALLYSKAAEGTDTIWLLGSFGEPYGEGKYHIKIIETLPPDDLEEG